jgi:Protein of unknown function (DUF1292).
MAADKAKDEQYNDDEPMVVTLEYDDGTEIETEVMGIFEVDGKEYIALIPDDDSDDVYLYGYAETGDEEFELIDIEDEEEFEKVVKEFDALLDVNDEQE